MAHRMQITLTDEQYERLRRASEETGVSIAELIRRRVDAGAGRPSLEERLAAFHDAAGAWSDDPDAVESGAEYVDRVRPGIAERLRRQGVEWP